MPHLSGDLRCGLKPPSVDGPDGPLTGRIAQKHRLALLALLARSPDGSLSRDKLMACLWPESDTQRARHLLSVALYVLRKGLGEASLLSQGDDLHLDTDAVRVDVVEFEAALEKGETEAAAALYLGPFLDGFYLSEASDFEKWVDGERASLARLYSEALEGLAVEAEALGDAVLAAEWWRQLATHNPHSGRIAAGLMRALVAAGDRGAAFNVARAHEAILREEFAAQPDPEVVALAEQLREEPNGSETSPGEPWEPTPGIATGRPSAPERPHRRSRPFRSLSLAAALVVTVVGVAWLWGPGRGRTEVAAATDVVLNPRRVLVLPFANETGDPELDPLGRMVADWTIQGIAQTGLVEVVSFPGALQLGQAQDDSPERLSDESAPAEALARSAAAGTVVWGSLYSVGGGLRIQAKAADVTSNKLLGSMPPVTVAREAPLEAVEQVRQRVMGLLAVQFGSELSSWAKSPRTPPLYDAYLEYLAGAEATTVRETYAHSARAATIDTAFTYALVRAFRYSGFLAAEMDLDSAAAIRDSLSNEVKNHWARLSPADRYEVQAIQAELRGDHAARYGFLKQAAVLSPDRLRALAGVAFQLGRYREAADIWRRPDLPLMGAQYPWKPLTAGLHFLGAHEEELDEARRGMELNPGDLRFFEMQTTALAALGRVDETTDAVAEGLRRGIGPMSPGRFLFNTGNELLWHGHEVAGLGFLRRAETTLRAEVHRGDERAYNYLAEALYFLSEWDELRKLADQRVPVASTGDIPSRYALLGMAAAKSADRAAALRYEERLIELEESLELRVTGYSRALLPWTRAQIAAALGECERAIGLLGDALSQGGGHQFIHRRPGFIDCKDDPAFVEAMRPHG